MNRKNNKAQFLKTAICIFGLLPILVFLSQPLKAQCGTSWALVNYQISAHVIRDIAYNGSLFAAVGDEGYIRSSTDGIDWTKRTASPFRRMHLFCATYAGGKFVAVGLFEYIVTSANGITWTERRYINGGVGLWGVAYGGGVYVAVGDNGRVLTSPDAITWTKRSSGIGGRLMDIVYADGKFVTTGTNQKFFVSTDGGITWNSYGSTATNMISITYGGGKFVAGGVGVVYTSTNGTAWTRVNPGLNNLFWDIVYAPAVGFIAVGNRGTQKNSMVATSANGSSWTWRESHVPSELLGVCAGGDRMVSGGVVGAVTTSLCSPPAAQVIVAGPNGGEELDGGTKRIIRWGTFGTVGNVKVEYSVNGGDSWNTISSSTPNDGALDWTVPNIPSSQCRIRISEAADGSPTDTSNANFTIAGGSNVTITLNSPNGGEKLIGGTSHNVRWTGSQKFDDIDIEYYNGSAWVVVVNGTTDDGQYNWTVPTNVSTKNARMWIKGWSSTLDPADYSDSTFEITQDGSVSTITVTSPNGGETLTGGTTHNIRWTGSKNYDRIDIEYHNGSTWVGIVTGTADDGKYEWNVPNIATTRARLWIKGWHDDGDAVDTTDDYFTIEKGVPTGTLLVTAPNGGETWLNGSTHPITWTTTGTVGNVKISYSSNDGDSWNTITSSTGNDGYYSWSLPAGLISDQCRVRVTSVSNPQVSDNSDTVFSVGGPPEISLSKNRFNFGYLLGAAVPDLPQTLFITNDGVAPLNWTASADVSWINLNPASGTGDGVVNLTINPAGLGVGEYTGTVTVSDPGAINPSETADLYLKVKNSSEDQPPFGQFATPEDGIGNVTGSIAVTGWALDDVGVVSVKIYREVNGGKAYIGDAVFVEGARPDVEVAYPQHPYDSRAGWGYMMLTNFLPEGELVLKAIAVDTTGFETTLGTKTIYLNHHDAMKPFGAIDTPAQGGDASGTNFRNQGWALTPQPSKIPEDGSTINVYIDGVFAAKANYNIYRSDIANLFSGYANTGGAMGYYDFDTTAYRNGVHSIQWAVTDNAQNSSGIGSRYFTIENTGSQERSGAAEAQPQQAGPPPEPYHVRPWPPESLKTRDINDIPVDRTPIRIRKGYEKNTGLREVYPSEGDISIVETRELERLAIQLGEDTSDSKTAYTGYTVIHGQRRALPVGSTMDSQRGIFYWQPGPGFVGEYELVFIGRNRQGRTLKKNILIKILPGFPDEK